MKIGMNMHLWSTHITDEHYADIGELKAIGYDGIEVFLAENDRPGYIELGNFLQSIDMEVNGCLGLGPDQDPISTDATVRQISRVEQHRPDHMHWPDLDVDLTLDMIDHPEKYPRRYE